MSFEERAKTEASFATTSSARVQRLVTGFGCEFKGCPKQGEWYVTLEDQSFHWCGAHTTKRMNDNKFWATQAKLRER
jgi:hypothetical protein